MAELLGNVTPTNADFIGKAITPLLSAELYPSVMDALSEQVNALKIDRVATSFKPRQVTYEQATGKVFVTGELTTQGPNAKADGNRRAILRGRRRRSIGSRRLAQRHARTRRSH